MAIVSFTVALDPSIADFHGGGPSLDREGNA
jgi:hypothetical protein